VSVNVVQARQLNLMAQLRKYAPAITAVGVLLLIIIWRLFL
jgi:hypothetical protein